MILDGMEMTRRADPVTRLLQEWSRRPTDHLELDLGLGSVRDPHTDSLNTGLNRYETWGRGEG